MAWSRKERKEQHRRDSRNCEAALTRFEQERNSDGYLRWRENMTNFTESKARYQDKPVTRQKGCLYRGSRYQDWIGADFVDAAAVEAESKQRFDVTDQWQPDQQIVVSLGDPHSYIKKVQEDFWEAIWGDTKEDNNPRSKITFITITIAGSSY